MKQHRFYQNIIFRSNTSLELTEKVANHVSRVLRMKAGQQICLFNGKDQQCLAILEEVKKRSVIVKLGEILTRSRESELKITLVQATSKGDRFDLVVQKAVELGVDKIIPVITERNELRLSSDRKGKKMQQWQGIIESASEQCGRNQLMILDEPLALPEYLNNKAAIKHFVLDPYSENNITQVSPPPTSAAFIIGPEGGFSDDEISLLKQANVSQVKFGPRILRTETAAISVCAIAQSLWGDLN